VVTGNVFECPKPLRVYRLEVGSLRSLDGED